MNEDYSLGYEDGFKAGQEDMEKQEKAFAQPEQEPVAWMDIDEKGFGYGLRYWSEPDNRHEVPLYTTPPQRTWVGLTDEEKADLFAGTAPYYNEADYANAIEAKLKAKNERKEKNT